MGKRIEEALSAKKISQTTLAAAMGISPQAVQQWVDGKTSPKRNRLKQLSILLDRSIEWLVTGKDDYIDGIVTSKTFGDDHKRLQEPPNHYHQPESNAEWAGVLDGWDSETPLNDDEVALPFLREVELSAGNGISEVQENHGAKLRFAKSTLRRQSVRMEAAYCVAVKGNSMYPMIPNGATIGIDTDKTEILDGEIYAIDHHGELRVKMVYRVTGGGIRLKSINSDEYPDEIYTDTTNIRILGRMFWCSWLR